MATIQRRGNEYIISVNMGYDYDSKKVQPVQKVVISPDNQTDSQRRAWLTAQADDFESEVKQRQTQAITVSEFAEIWLADLSKISYERNGTDLKWILPQLGSCDLKRLTPKLLADFHSKIKAETSLAFTSREHIHRTLCTMLSEAVAQGHIKLNPAFRTFKYEKKADGKQTLTKNELKTFADCLADESPKHQLFYKILLATGIKRAECVGLKWSDVDRLELGEKLKTQLNSYKIKDDGYIFSQPNGCAMCPSSFTYRLNLIRKKHGLPMNLTMQAIYTTHAELLKKQGGTDRKSYLKLQRKLGL